MWKVVVGEGVSSHESTITPPPTTTRYMGELWYKLWHPTFFFFLVFFPILALLTWGTLNPTCPPYCRPSLVGWPTLSHMWPAVQRHTQNS